MAVASRGQAREVQKNVQRRWKERSETSPERTKVWTEPKLKCSGERKVPVVYYLSRNGQLEHPHFMEVPLSTPEGLFLRDVINRLNGLRGKAMATMYSWSSKRSYRNGFVWHDLSENDFIYPAHGHEYVLKGSELQLSDPASYDPKVLESASSRCLKPPPEIMNRGGDGEFPAIARRRNQSWSSIDLHEYKVYKADSVGDSAGKSCSAAAAADAATQTDEKRRRRRTAETEEKEDGDLGEIIPCVSEMVSTELSRGEISPPPSDSSPETLETLMKVDGRQVIRADDGGSDRTAESAPGGRGRAARGASSVLMQLLSCGSMSFKDCGPTLVKDHGMSLIGQHSKPRGAGNPGGVKLEDKEYFSGSLVETNKHDVVSSPTLQRSTSYNADGSSRLELTEEEIGVRTKCIPRKAKAMASKRESNIITSCDVNGQGGSKRHDIHA